MAFVILCDRCGAMIKPSNSSYVSASCTMNERMGAFLICERCYDELTTDNRQRIIGNEMEDDE